MDGTDSFATPGIPPSSLIERASVDWSHQSRDVGPIYLDAGVRYDEYGVEWSSRSMRTTSTIVSITTTAGGTVDDASLGVDDCDDWSVTHIVLAGTAFAWSAQEELQPGAVLAAASLRDAGLSRPSRGARTLSIASRSQSGGTGNGPRLGRLPSGTLERIVEEAASPGPRAFRELFGLLVEEGLLPRREPSPHWEGDNPLQVFALALAKTMFPLSRQPMLQDICKELHVGSRQVTRLSSRYFKRYHVRTASYREYALRRRLQIAAMLLHDPRVKLPDAARLVGLHSASALCHMFRNFGWPAPRDTVDALCSRTAFRPARNRDTTPSFASGREGRNEHVGA